MYGYKYARNTCSQFKKCNDLHEVIPLNPSLGKPFKRQPHKMVKHIQTINSSAVAVEYFECV